MPLDQIQSNHYASRTADVIFDREKLDGYDNECTDIYFFTQREISLIYSAIRYAEWEARWVDRDLPVQLVETVKEKLLMLCARDLIKAQVAVVHALTGRSINLADDSAVEGFLTSYLNFEEDGVVPAIDRLSGASEEEDYTDELNTIATILGAVIV